MGNYDSCKELRLNVSDALPDGIYIAARADYLEGLKSGASSRSLDSSVLVPLHSDEQIPAEVLSSAKTLVLEVDPASPQSLGRIASTRASRPDLPIIAALHEADVSLTRTLIRQGVADVAGLPFDPDELASQVLDLMAKMAERMPQARLAPLVALARSTGGCGTTTIITHLAAAIAKEHQLSVCIVDLDLQNGDVATFLGETSQTSVTDLLDAGDRVDDELLSSAIVRTRYGLSIIAAPEMVTPLDVVHVDQLRKLLEFVRRRFDWVIVDLPANWTNWALTVAVEASNLFLVTDLSISSLRQARRRLQLFESVGLRRNQTRIIVNRVEKRLFKTIGIDDVEVALKSDVVAGLAMEGTAMRSAQDQGVLITDITSRSKFAGDVSTLAQLLVGKG